MSIKNFPLHDEILEKRKTIKKKKPGIYLLFDGDEVVYVGKSKAPDQRIQTHLLSTKKIFDSYSIIPANEEDLNSLETKYIFEYCPKYNKSLPGKKNLVGSISPKTKNQKIIVQCIILDNKLYIDLSDQDFNIYKKPLQNKPSSKNLFGGCCCNSHQNCKKQVSSREGRRKSECTMTDNISKES